MSEKQSKRLKKLEIAMGDMAQRVMALQMQYTALYKSLDKGTQRKIDKEIAELFEEYKSKLQGGSDEREKNRIKR
jgi:hypothetical protein